MKILILGSTGFLGSYLKKYFSRRKDLKLIESSRDDYILRDKKIYLSSSLREKLSLADICINCIANTNFISCENEKSPSTANILIPQEICRHATNENYFIHFSSDIFYEDVNNNSNEDSKLTLNNAYAEQKKLSEEIFLNANSIILRTSFLGFSARNSGLFNSVLNSINYDKEIEGWSNVFSSSVSIHNIFELIDFLLLKNIRLNGIYNFGTLEPYSKYNYISELLKKFNKEKLLKKISFSPSKISRNLNSGMVSDKISNETDFKLPSFGDVIANSHKELNKLVIKK